MEKKQSKKCLILLVLKYLESLTDEKNPMTQVKLAKLISESFDCDRKTVCRNINALIQLGYPIIKTKNGFYLSKKKFSIEEVNFITASIIKNQDKPLEEKEEIINRLLPILNKSYR